MCLLWRAFFVSKIYHNSEKIVNDWKQAIPGGENAI